MTNRAFIALGSNLGDRRSHLDQAIAALACVPGVTVLAVSTYHETAPVGGPPHQGPFLNAAAAIETDLDPFALLRELQRIEAEAGRERTVPWGPRTLDLDLLLFGDQVIATHGLTVPHPYLSARRFVLAPLAEIAPNAVEPTSGRTIARLLADLDTGMTARN